MARRGCPRQLDPVRRSGRHQEALDLLAMSRSGEGLEGRTLPLRVRRRRLQVLLYLLAMLRRSQHLQRLRLLLSLPLLSQPGRLRPLGGEGLQLVLEAIPLAGHGRRPGPERRGRPRPVRHDERSSPGAVL